MNEIILEISAFGVALFCFVDCLKNRKGLYESVGKGWINKLKDQHYAYLCLLFTLMISALSSVLEVSMEKYFSFKSAAILNILNQIYFIFHTLLSLMYAFYIINITGELKKTKKRFFYIFVSPMVLAELLIITNPLTKLLFYVDENLVYQRGSCLWTLYVVAVFYVLYGIAFFMKHMEHISKPDRASVFILMFIAVLVLPFRVYFP